MSVELAVLRLFCDDRQLHDMYHPYLSSLRNLERELKVIARLVHDFYDRHDALAISKEDLLIYFDVQYPNNKDRMVYRELIHAIFSTHANPDVARDLLEQVMEKHYAAELISKLMPVIEGNKFGILSTIEPDLKEYLLKMKNPPGTVGLEPFEKSLEDLAALVYPEGGLNWLCHPLMRTIGPVMRGTLGAIFAYVDGGKTSFGVRNLVHFAEQLKDTEEILIYAGNEEAASRVAMRATQAATNMTRQEILSDTTRASSVRATKGWSRIKLFDNITSSMQVSSLLQQYQPTVLFIDQGTKVTVPGAKEANDVAQLQDLFNFYREAAKQYNTAIICLAQATGEAENKKWLKLSDMYGSRVSMQGELDYAIGIGKILEDPAREHVRYIHVPKNKLLDGEKCKFMTAFTKEKCQWQDL
jgi:hypothetical protein